MSRLDELIAELCPDGVEYTHINDVCKSLSKGTLKQDKLNDTYEYPVMNSGRGFYGFFNDYNNNGNAITIAARGEYAGYINYIDCKFWAGGLCYPYRSIDENQVLTKYIFYILKNEEQKIMDTLVARGSIPALNKKDIDDYKIPVPPVEVQSEIVRILDNFTELTAQLTAELTARKKQYEYYREYLLTQSGDTPKVELKTVVKKSCSGATPKKGNSAYYENGTVPWLRTQDVLFNEIYEINSFITEEAVKKTSAKWIPINCVIVAISGATAGRCAINKIATTTNQHCLNMEIDSSKALYKYIFYCVCSQYEELLSRKQGARGDLNSTLIMGIEIPLPSLEEQQRIVEILDKFDTLTTDISAGLPAEIEARQKQYEYYRDKLLTFKELS